MDRKYIAPQLSLWEAVTAGVFGVLHGVFFVLLVNFWALVVNIFSPAFPWRWKLCNAVVLAGLLSLVAGAIAALIRLW